MQRMVESRKGSDGLNYFEIGLKYNGKDYTTEALFKTGSEVTIISNELVGISVEGLKEMKADIGMETIKVYELPIDSFLIGGEKIKGVEKIYVSELDYFKNIAFLGCDVLEGLSYSANNHGIKLEINEL